MPTHGLSQRHTPVLTLHTPFKLQSMSDLHGGRAAEALTQLMNSAATRASIYCGIWKWGWTDDESVQENLELEEKDRLISVPFLAVGLGGEKFQVFFVVVVHCCLFALPNLNLPLRAHGVLEHRSGAWCAQVCSVCTSLFAVHYLALFIWRNSTPLGDCACISSSHFGHFAKWWTEMGTQ